MGSVESFFRRLSFGFGFIVKGTLVEGVWGWTPKAFIGERIGGAD
jgi:hypothetical protein